jgi:hypothetical protein
MLDPATAGSSFCLRRPCAPSFEASHRLTDRVGGRSRLLHFAVSGRSRAGPDATHPVALLRPRRERPRRRTRQPAMNCRRRISISSRALRQPGVGVATGSIGFVAQSHSRQSGLASWPTGSALMSATFMHRYCADGPLRSPEKMERLKSRRRPHSRHLSAARPIQPAPRCKFAPGPIRPPSSV